MRGGRAAEFVAILILALGTWLGMATSGAPALRSAHEAVAPGEFSMVAAANALKEITKAPHPVGSAEHDRIRDYLVDRLRALGLESVHVQSATGFNTLAGPLAATVANVVGRKRGTHPGPALLLSAHYDAVPRSFGAGDDGVGVAAILGTLEALANQPPLDRDVIVVFNDAEEDGLLGAEAFVDLHPWAKDVGIVLNFDGRGTTGPVYMFQSSPGNASLIDALAVVGKDARANSLTGEVYRHLPSDTDMSIWLHSVFPVGALNFAHVGGYTHYHTPTDDMASFDPRVLQQMGEYALSLTSTLGASVIAPPRTTDAIYFNAPFLGLVHYPAKWAVILSIDGLALVLLLLGIGMYRGTVTIRGMAVGAKAMLVTLLVPVLVVLAAWQLIRVLHPGFREILQRDPYNSLWYLLAASAFTVAVAVTAHRRFSADPPAPAADAMELAMAPLLLWGILGVVIASLLPGASYLIAWPLFAATMCASWWRRETGRGRIPPAWLALFAIPALILWPPLVMALEVALTVNMLPFCALLLALMLSILVMPLQLAGDSRRWIVRIAAVVAVVALVRAELAAGFTETRKRPDSLSYVVDRDSAKAWWVSFDHAVDSWTGHTLGESPPRRAFDDFGLGDSVRTLFAANAPSPTQVESPIHVVANGSTEGGHRVHLHIDKSGIGEMISILADTTATIIDMVINTRVLANGKADRYSPRYQMGATGIVLRYFGVPEDGIDVQFTIAGTASSTFRVVTATEGLPSGTTPRPASMMSKPFVQTDMTISAWRIQL